MLDFCKAALFVVVLSCGACAHDRTVPPGAGGVEVRVMGTAANVQAFDQALQPKIQGLVVGCARCNQLGTVDSVTYAFFSNQTLIYQKFGEAWDSVAGSKPEMIFMPGTTQPDCTVKPACYNLWPCLQYGRCTTDSTLRSCKGPC